MCAIYWVSLEEENVHSYAGSLDAVDSGTELVNRFPRCTIDDSSVRKTGNQYCTLNCRQREETKLVVCTKLAVHVEPKLKLSTLCCEISCRAAPRVSSRAGGECTVVDLICMRVTSKYLHNG